MVKQNQVDIMKSAKTGQKNQHKIVSEIFLKNKKKKQNTEEIATVIFLRKINEN